MSTETILSPPVEAALRCFHCGQPCDEVFYVEDKPFCCFGCKSVFEILNANDLCEYYQLDAKAGVSLKEAAGNSYDYLDEPPIRRKLLQFDSADFAKIVFHVPSIHCVSCIWLLENLRRLDAGVLAAEVGFGKKTVTIDFDPHLTSPGRIAARLASIGYAPRINLDSERKDTPVQGKSLVYRLALAGFVFGNVMLFSFPEYLGLDNHDEYLMRIFSFLNLALSIPVFFYSAAEYFSSAWASFRQKAINIDVPIAAGLLALFLRSAYDIITATGPGYLDSFAGLVFFLLIGRWFQSRTYESLAFDRDYKSYFPLAVQRFSDDGWKPSVIYDLRKGDRIRVRNMEIVPADSTLVAESAYFDYSFVTGEARPVRVVKGDLVYAGGRLVGEPVILVVGKETSQSHLTSLWNSDAFRKTGESTYRKIIDRAARRFTWIVMGIAVLTAVYWQMYNPAEMWLVLTSVLMVACPCALALAAPFTYGSMLRVFGNNNFYLKNADIIEKMAGINAVVFDKTGTITHGKSPQAVFNGILTTDELSAVKTITAASTHPLSTIITRSIQVAVADGVTGFRELPGKGIEASVNGKFIQVGSAAFVSAPGESANDHTRVFVAIDRTVKGFFIITTSVRSNLRAMLHRLGNRCRALLSGDNDADRERMKAFFPADTELLFDQNPHQKLSFIQAEQAKGRKVLMVGDGLNDSGALQQSDVGIAVSDDSGVFTPACDGIIYGEKLQVLDRFLSLAKASSVILKVAFGISFFYNAIALAIAVTGNLTPLVAAILMPVSSISVVGFATAAVNIVSKRKLKNQSI